MILNMPLRIRVVWHQLFRKSLTSYGTFISHGVLRIDKQRYPLFSRYLNLFLAFFVSGALHFYMDVTAGVPASKTHVIWFFCLQAFGIMFEDAVQELYRRMTGKSAGRELVWYEKLIGYIWVVAFLVWSTPTWTYPTIRHAGKDRMVPVSIVDLMRS